MQVSNEILMRLDLINGDKIRGAQLFPIGKWTHPQGDENITFDRAQKFAQGFRDRIAGQDLPVLFLHDNDKNRANPRYGQAAGWITDMRADEQRGVLIDIDLTTEGAADISAGKYRYLSAEYFKKVQLPHHDRPYEDVIIAAALVNNPHLKGMDPILNEATGHLFSFGIEEAKDDLKGDSLMDPILLALAKSAGLEISDDVKELTDDQRATINSYVKGSDESKKVTELEAKLALVQKRLDAAEDSDTKQERTLAEAGFEAEALLLAEYRGDKLIAELAESVPTGSILTPAVKEKIKSYAVDGDPMQLSAAMALIVSGKGVVDLTERGSDSTKGTTTTKTTASAADRLLTQAEILIKEDEKLDLSTAIDLVAAKDPKLWNEYQSEQTSTQVAHLEVVV